MILSAGLERLRAGSALAGADLAWTEELPEPARELLCHERDMTSTLARFHGAEIALECLRVVREEDFYGREVVLKAGGRVVEYGLIEIRLAAFPEDLRERILAGREPLGAILNGSGRRYVSAPVGFLEVRGFRVDVFPSFEVCFGRVNQLSWDTGEVLAHIVEILPEFDVD
ncbi:MAG: hypothetical protein ACQKBY_09625 [Verrucomicrobiales bacterium]